MKPAHRPVRPGRVRRRDARAGARERPRGRRRVRAARRRAPRSARRARARARPAARAPALLPQEDAASRSRPRSTSTAALGADLNVLASVQVFLPREITDAPRAQEPVLPPVALAALPRRRGAAVADHPGRARDRRVDLRARRRRRHRAGRGAEGRGRALADARRPRRFSSRSCSRSASRRWSRRSELVASGRARAREAGRVARDRAGSGRRCGRGDLRSTTPARGDRPAGARLRSAARRVPALRGQAGAAVRRGARGPRSSRNAGQVSSSATPTVLAIALRGGVLRVKRVRAEAGKEAAAISRARVGLDVGQRFESGA